MMINLSGQKLQTLPLGNLTWKRDLIYFEGPLLSEFSSDKGEVYLKYWCDCDDTFNRWMFFKVKEQDRLRLVLGEKSLYDVIVNQPDSFVFVSDESRDIQNYTFLEAANLPNEYLPEEDSYLEIDDYVDDEKITSLVFEDQWDFEELKNVYRKFAQIYDFIFVSNSISGRLGASMPWQGGASAVHFYNKIKELIPSNDASRLNAIHYASPGYMKISVNRKVSDIALTAINNYGLNKKAIDSLYLELQNRIKELDLNNISSSDAMNIFDNDDKCIDFYTELVDSLSGFDMSWLSKFVDTNFERCKIVLTHVRRLRSFQNYLGKQSVRVVSPLITSE
ncbi:hypothetical protein [Photobacterium sp. GB-50]|uniref:hypothetical protein n=1 Tax=Photobacterium sp. GB-50 TaxID=2022107 RepID=UPI0018EC90AE|nr:hypothetical protein [Photobacterium sp. GB-50]